MARIITVVAHDPGWNLLYREEAALIGSVLGENLLEIHHIGSTAVAGLRAKPIIDMMPVVADVRQVDAKSERFRRIGYECMGEFGIAGRRFFRKGGAERTHHIHIFEAGNRADIDRHLAVRDYLRAHPEEAEAYGVLKSRLAELYPADIDGYCDGKDFFVKELEREALAWWRSGCCSVA